MKTYELLQTKREEILQLAAKYGAYNVRVLGAAIHPEAAEDSKIEFLITMEPKSSLFDRAALLVELEQMLHHEVNVFNEQGLSDRYREFVLQEAIPL